jgi:RNA polymerase sigma-70 factor, ECF subfamily
MGDPQPSQSHASQREVTRLLAAVNLGDPEALSQVFPLIYADLRDQAERFLGRERSGHTLQPTALVNEAYLRLVDQTRVEWKSRQHFFAVAATVMRRILVNHARDRSRLKRGGGARRVELHDSIAEAPADAVDLVALDEALDNLARMDPRAAQVVELRYFAGLSNEAAADVLDVAVATVKRDWNLARAWLFRELNGDLAAGDSDGAPDR